MFLTEHPTFVCPPTALHKPQGGGHSYHTEAKMSTRQQNNPNFRINVFVYHPKTGDLVASYPIDQVVPGHKTNFNATVKACHNVIEAAQSTDGLRYVYYCPIYESWVQGGNRVIESTIA